MAITILINNTPSNRLGLGRNVIVGTKIALKISNRRIVDPDDNDNATKDGPTSLRDIKALRPQIKNLLAQDCKGAFPKGLRFFFARLFWREL